MFPVNGNTATIKTTSHKVVVPFYIYAALSFLAATILLLFSARAFGEHYFHPKTLAITHIMALGWGTMIILGASHQLVPVLIEGKLYSNKLAYASFVLAAIGVPLMSYAFYIFDMGHPAKWGGRFILLSILCYLINLWVSISRGKGENIHALFVFASVIWLFITAFLGLMLVYNFTYPFLSHDSLHYLPLHVHAGVVGWFLLLVMGVGSRLIPMFLISKYTNFGLLRWVFYLVNFSLVSYIIIFYFSSNQSLAYLSALSLLAGIGFFIYYCYKCFKERIRKHVDEQMKLSLLSVGMILVPVVLLLGIIALMIGNPGEHNNLALAYGFVILFGWITAIILGMTFKTLPFIVWNQKYHLRAASGKVPSPKDLFSNRTFVVMSAAYFLGFATFVTGIFTGQIILLQAGAFSLILAAVLYNWNVFKIITHKPVVS